ncbi:hypothetical protein [Streptomyces longispororuber]|uniref:hypothetical protein n=1 Tax=Streptomyces longispororuber TaxID=68230 RepID=UPI00210D7FE8|nr:hypothetical protein [Streptomyces longispororuber]MCQ4213156.1 hypothetical protein [Streptomyces longispororuber]
MTDVTVVDRPLTALLKQRGLYLNQERSDAAEIMYVCLRDGLPGGYPVGYVLPSRTGTWFAYARSRPGRVFACDQVESGLFSVESAVRAVLGHARYGDVLRAMELAAGSTATYTADLPRRHAARLAALAEPDGVTRLGAGRVRLTAAAVAYLRGLPERHGPHVDHENRIWLTGDSYPLLREPRAR